MQLFRANSKAIEESKNNYTSSKYINNSTYPPKNTSK
jgi:hypothetical protein